MRVFGCMLVLCLANTETIAQSVKQPASLPEKSAADIKAIDERVAFWRTTCLQDWDAGTHMTRTEWRTTCLRVAAERRTFLLQDSDSFSMDAKRRQR
jgi:hypothetical protein